ncbi:MAG TPA: carboxypeptidase-like regulatory domain-containing protein, partial [Pyrinomonadaceae bacterium]|nr:carboxypeptidase-like regulatory domain-containing protein [Pyrinomonadaceae bacterium]
MRSALRLLSGAILSLLCAITVFAQASQTGGITGVVTDPGGALVQGATIDLVNESTGKSERTATTGGDGGYSFTLLKPGSYRLEITAQNFKKAVITAVPVRIGESTRQDVALEAGRIEETVNVEASATLINPSSAVTGQPLTAE